jgi:hypothetical protein
MNREGDKLVDQPFKGERVIQPPTNEDVELAEQIG